MEPDPWRGVAYQGLEIVVSPRFFPVSLSADDQARFEEAYLSDGSLFDQVRAPEEELIEDYVRERL